MRKALIGALMIGAIALGAPRTADAHVSVAIGLPGLGFFFGAPAPYAYAPPVAYVPPPPVVYGPPVYYAPRPYPFYRYGYARPYYRHHGWY